MESAAGFGPGAPVSSMFATGKGAARTASAAARDDDGADCDGREDERNEQSAHTQETSPRNSFNLFLRQV